MASNRFQILRDGTPQQARIQDSISSVVAPVATAVQNTPIMGASPPMWELAQLTNGWVPFTQTGVPYSAPSFQLDSLGYVHLRGVMKNPAAGLFSATVLFTLPLKYRPAYRKVFVSSAGLRACGMYIEADGTMLGDWHDSATPETIVFLDGLEFQAGG